MEQRGRPQDRPDWDYIPKYKKGASVEKALGKAKKNTQGSTQNHFLEAFGLNNPALYKKSNKKLTKKESGKVFRHPEAYNS